MKLVINKIHGGFGLSHTAIMRYAELAGFKLFWWIDDTTKRIQPNYSVETAFIVHYSRIPIKDEADFTAQGKTASEAYFNPRNQQRDDPNLIRVVEELGVQANSQHAKLEIVEIPDGVEWVIQEYDGLEWVAEKHRT